MSVSNPLSPYFNLDPATAAEVVDPTAEDVELEIDAQPGEAFLVDVSAHYPATPGRAPLTVGFLEVVYVK